MISMKHLLVAAAGVMLAHGTLNACEASKNKAAFNRYQAFQKQKQMPQFNRFQQQKMPQQRFQQQMPQWNRMQQNYYAQQRTAVPSQYNRFQQYQRPTYGFQPIQQRMGNSFNRVNPMLQNQMRFTQPTWRGPRMNLR